MSAMLSRYLKDFSAEREAPVSPPHMSFIDDSIFPGEPEAPPVDIEAERREAYAAGHEAASAELTEQHRRAIEEMAEAHGRELEEMRVQYDEAAAERIAAGLNGIASAVARTVGDGAANVLAPVMTEELVARAVAGLADLVSASILDGAVGQITVCGPRKLFDMLTARLGSDDMLLRHVESSDIDLTVTIGESALVSRMSAWADSLKKVLA